MLFVSLNRVEFLPAEAIELRLDLFDSINIHELRYFLREAKQPVLLTLRSVSHGGKFQGSEKEREALILRLLALEPPFFDLEYGMRPEFIRTVLELYPKTKFVLSYHHFDEIPPAWDALYESMAQFFAFSYKIAAMTHSVNDALKMLLFAKQHPRLSVVCMGERGQFARVLGPVVGNGIDFAKLDEEEETGPGQLTVSELRDVYHFPRLNPQTAIYGLIGNPVAHSVGHRHHNGVFRRIGMDAVYVKMAVEPHELSTFIPLAQQLGIRGLSVTAPLKESILPYIQRIDPQAATVGAVNTLRFEQEGIFGFSTDGRGALNALEKHGAVHGKKIVLLGAGGASRAIAYEAKRRGALVLVLNRTVSRAELLAKDLGCEAGGLDAMPGRYDILINATSSAMPIDANRICPDTLTMDIGYFPRETLFLQEAKKRGCPIIYGEEMYIHQAEEQTRLWTSL